MADSVSAAPIPLPRGCNDITQTAVVREQEQGGAWHLRHLGSYKYLASAALSAGGGIFYLRQPTSGAFAGLKVGV